MRQDIVDILEYLELDDEMSRLRRQVLEGCKNQAGARQIIIRLQNDQQQNMVQDHDNQGFYSLFIACAYHNLSNFAEALNNAKISTTQLAQRNKILAKWIVGLIYLDQGQSERARKELENAKKELKKRYWRRVNGSRLRESLHAKIDQAINNLPAQDPGAGPAPFVRPWNDQDSPEHPDLQTSISLEMPIDINNENRPTFRPSIDMSVNALAENRNKHIFVEPPIIMADSLDTESNTEPNEGIVDAEGYLILPWLPVSGEIQAGSDGPMWVDNSESSDTEVQSVRIDGESCKIYSVKRKDLQITLNKNKKYSWAKVRGQSMNRAKPVAIEEGDHVLFALLQFPGQDATDNDIVVVSQRLEEGSTEFTYMVKRYDKVNKTLYSETSIDGYKPVPLSDDVRILGIVSAVAKNPKRNET